MEKLKVGMRIELVEILSSFCSLQKGTLRPVEYEDGIHIMVADVDGDSKHEPDVQPWPMLHEEVRPVGAMIITKVKKKSTLNYGVVRK